MHGAALCYGVLLLLLGIILFAFFFLLLLLHLVLVFGLQVGLERGLLGGGVDAVRTLVTLDLHVRIHDVSLEHALGRHQLAAVRAHKVVGLVLAGVRRPNVFLHPLQPLEVLAAVGAPEQLAVVVCLVNVHDVVVFAPDLLAADEADEPAVLTRPEAQLVPQVHAVRDLVQPGLDRDRVVALAPLDGRGVEIVVVVVVLLAAVAHLVTVILVGRLVLALLPPTLLPPPISATVADAVAATLVVVHEYGEVLADDVLNDLGLLLEALVALAAVEVGLEHVLECPVDGQAVGGESHVVAGGAGERRLDPGGAAAGGEDLGHDDKLA